MPVARRRNQVNWWCSPFAREPISLRAEVTALQGPATASLPAQAVTLRLVDTVRAPDPADLAGRMRRWPDVLRSLPTAGFSAEPGEARCLWVTVTVPADAKPGDYTGAIKLVAASGETQALPLQLRVHNLLLPSPQARDLRLGLWQDWAALGRQYQVEPWSDRWWELVEGYLRNLAAHGQTGVQVGRGYFDWRQDVTGQWTFDFARFDRYVKLCDQAGLRGIIEYVQMFNGRGATTLYYTDADDHPAQVKASPGEPQFDVPWAAFARALALHCREQGWMGRLMICPTDQPREGYGPATYEQFRKCADLLRQADPGYHVSAAFDSRAALRALSPYADRVVILAEADVYDAEFAQRLRAQGKLTELFVSSVPARPNTFITSAAHEPRLLGWLLRHEELEGLMRWSYASWPADPFGQPAGESHGPAGDLFLVYPGPDGPLDSLRWERLREGCEDWEMLREVQRRVLKAPDSDRKRAAAGVLQKAWDRVCGPPGKLQAATTDPEAILQPRQAILEAVDKLIPQGG